MELLIHNHEKSKMRTTVRSQPLQILNEQAEKNTFQLSDVNWQLPLNAQLNWMPESMVYIRHLPGFKNMSASHRLRYNQLYAQAICEQFIWFEMDVINPILKQTLHMTKLNNDLREAIEHFISDEDKHSEMFLKLLQKIDSQTYQSKFYKFLNMNAVQSRFYKTIINNPKYFISWIWMAIYFEERTMHFSRLYKEQAKINGEPAIDQTFARCHYLHMIDEARHLQIDQYFLKYLYDTEPLWKRKIAGWVFKKVMMAYVAPHRMAIQVFSVLKSEFSSDHVIFDQVIKELPTLPNIKSYRDEMFGDKALPRTRELLSRYPEMSKALSVIR